MATRISELTARMRAWAATQVEAQRGRVFLWLPVTFGAGAALYLSLLFEPSWWWLAPPFISMWLAVWLARSMNWPVYIVHGLIVLAILVSGMAVCKLRAEHAAAPIMGSNRNQYRIEALVVDVVSSNREEPRLLLAPTRIKGLPATATPLRLRVSLRPEVFAESSLRPGDTISAFAILNPPPAPFMPGGYDFARTAWFQGIGGVGLIPGTPQKVTSTAAPWRLRAVMALNRLRWNLAGRLVRDISPGFDKGPALGGFAAALVSGHQAFVPRDLVVSLRNSGLAHILSISGVHMAIVGGFAFFTLRGLLAMIPAIALRVPVKKVAAGFAILLLLLYLAISGAPAPAIRAAVVACVAFGAILFDRRALSLRGLAIAAFIVIAITPEAVVQPGFLMSFTATAALLAFSESVVPRIREVSVPLWVRAIQSSIEGVRLSLLASLVATSATTPFSIAFFNRFTVYGLASNLFEAPISAFIVMPALAIATLGGTTPVGWLGARIAGAGLWLIERIAVITADLPHAVLTWPSPPGYILAVSFAGMMWMCLVKGKSRWAGLVLASAMVWWPPVTPPDVWIDPQGGNAAIRQGKTAFVLRDRVRQYGFEQWTQHYGLEAKADARDKVYVCRGYGCIPKPGADYRVAFWFSNKPPKDKLLADMCSASDFVVLRNPAASWPAQCNSVNRLTASDLKASGAIEMTRTASGWTIRSAQPLRGIRFWTQPSEAEAVVSDSGGSG